MAKIANNIFVHEVCYEPGMPAKNIVQVYKAVKFESSPLYCEHDPDMIKQLRLLELMVIPAAKGPGSIKAGIAKVNEYNVFYTASSKNIDNERKKYMWMMDPVTNKPTNVPVPGLDHHMDEIRYGVYTHFYRS